MQGTVLNRQAFPTLYSTIVLDAAMPVADALSRLHEHRVAARVVIRRQIELELFYYVFRVEELLHLLTGGDEAGAPAPGDAIGSILNLSARVPARALNAEQLLRSGRHAAGVLMDGTAILGVWDPRPASRAATDVAVQHEAPDDTGMVATAPEPSPNLRVPDFDETPATPSQPASAAAPAAASTRPGFSLPKLPDFLKRVRESVRTASVGGTASGLEAGKPAAAAAAPSSSTGAPMQFRAHPRLELESDVVEPGSRFDLTIGLSREPVSRVPGSAVTGELPGGITEFELEVQLVADGFASPAGWRFRLRVQVAAPERAQLRVPLIAPNDAMTRLTVLEVHFTYSGSPCGIAFRKIAVQPAAQAVAGAPSAAPAGGQSWVATALSGEIVLDTSEPAADLWITISKPDGNDATGKYFWSFKSPHPIPLPVQPIEIDLGADARTFAEKMIRAVSRAEGTPFIDQALAAVGRHVREKAPPELEDVLHAVWASVHPGTGCVPTILLQTAEPHVPWELARLNDPPDPNRPPFLGAQFTVGRWIFGARGVSVLPAREIPVRAMAVVAGDYRSGDNQRSLLKSEAEGEELARRWGALRLKATVEDMSALLEGGLEQNGTRVGGAEAIHIAGHGEVDPRNPQDSLIYLDSDWPLDATLFLEAPVGRSHQPFLFLNACQVGQSGELLGDYAGFAGFCLRSGFRGVVAPLWSVCDDIAHEIALQFYDDAFGDQPVPVAEVLRRVRCRYPASEKVPPATWLAYVFYGHPGCILRRSHD